MIDSLFWLYADNYRTYNVDVARKLRSIHAAILLSELASRFRYHRDRKELISDAKQGDGWFYYTHEAVEERTCLTRKNQDTAIEILEKSGLIEKRQIGVPAKRHFRLNPQAIHEFFFGGSGQTRLSETDKLDCPNQTNCTVRNGQTAPYIYKPKEEPKEKERKVTAKAESSPEAKDVCVFLLDRLKKKNPSFKDPNLDRWQQETDRILRIDKRTPDQLKTVIEWAFEQDDDFWPTTLQSPTTLRKLFDRAWAKITHKSKAQLEQEKSKHVKNRADENLSWALATLGKISFSRERWIEISDHCVYIRNGRDMTPVGYAEPSFRQIIESKLRTWGYV